MAGRPPLAVGALGNVTAWKDGEAWRARARTRTAGGEVKRLFASGRSEDEVRAALKSKADAHAFSAREMSVDATLSELLEMWLDDKSGEIKSQSVQQYRDTVRWLRPIAGSLSVADLTPARITQLLKVIGDEHSENKRRLARGALKAALQFPVDAGLLLHNPILSVRKERRRRQPLPTALNVEQVGALRRAIAVREERVRRYAGAVAAQHLRWVVEIQLGSGLRISEVLALRHRDVDLHEGVLSVTATMVEDDEYHLIRQNELKGRDQARVIELPRFAIVALFAMRNSTTTLTSSQADLAVDALRTALRAADETNARLWSTTLRLFELQTGADARLSELIALRHQDVDLTTGEVTIAGSVRDGSGERTEPRGHRVRVVQVSGRSLSALLDASAAAASHARTAVTDLVFADDTRRVPHPGRVRQALRAMAATPSYLTMIANTDLADSVISFGTARNAHSKQLRVGGGRPVDTAAGREDARKGLDHADYERLRRAYIRPASPSRPVCE